MKKFWEWIVNNRITLLVIVGISAVAVLVWENNVIKLDSNYLKIALLLVGLTWGIVLASSKTIVRFFSQLTVWVIAFALILIMIVFLLWEKFVYANEPHNTIRGALFLLGLFASFTALLLTKDQDDRLKNSAFGGLVSTGLAALASMLNKDGNTQIEYLLFSSLGSAIGAFFGWYIHAMIAARAYDRYLSPLPLIELVTNGLKGIRDQIIAVENSIPLKNLNEWMSHASKDLKEKTLYILRSPNGLRRREIIIQTIEACLSTVCTVHNLLYRTNQMRASIIHFRFENNDWRGYHWIQAKNLGNPFDLTPFDNSSIAYKLKIDTTGKVYEHVDTEKNKPNMQDRTSEKRYKYFSLFKIDDTHILTLDWPDDIVDENKNLIKGFFEMRALPQFRKLIRAI